MERRVPLQPMSSKRRQALAAAGNASPYSTLTNSTTGRGSVSRPVVPTQRKAPAYTGPSTATVSLVVSRDRGQCVCCGNTLAGARGRDWSVQHRRARGAGGSRRSDTNQPANLILLCGSATTGCHGRVESKRAEARAFGWSIRQHEDPAVKPVRHALHGWVLLTADGGFKPYSPNHNQPTEVPA